MNESVERLRAALAGIHAQLAAVEGFAGPVREWGPGHVLAHSAEMLPYWLGEIERVLDDDRDPAPFGRVQSDPVRIGVLERDSTLPVRELFSRLRSETERVCGRLGEFTPEEISRRCVHSTLGEMTIGGLVEEFLVSHLEQHAAQLRDVLAGR